MIVTVSPGLVLWGFTSSEGGTAGIGVGVGVGIGVVIGVGASVGRIVGLNRVVCGSTEAAVAPGAGGEWVGRADIDVCGAAANGAGVAWSMGCCGKVVLWMGGGESPEGGVSCALHAARERTRQQSATATDSFTKCPAALSGHCISCDLTQIWNGFVLSRQGPINGLSCLQPLPSVAFPRAFRAIAIRLVLVKAQPLKALVRVTFTQEQVYRRSYGVLLEP